MLRDLVLRNFWLKVAALVSAVFIWLTVHAAMRKEQDLSNYPTPATVDVRTIREVPVHVVSADADVSGYKANPDHVAVTVRGPTEIVAQLQSDGLRALVDLTGFGRARPAQKAVQVVAPPETMFVRAEPGVVAIVAPDQ